MMSWQTKNHAQQGQFQHLMQRIFLISLKKGQPRLTTLPEAVRHIMQHWSMPLTAKVHYGTNTGLSNVRNGAEQF